MESDKKKRLNLSVTDKLKLIDRVKAGESREAILKETGLGARTLQRFMSTEDDIRKKASSCSPCLKRKRSGKHEDVDEAMKAWFTAMRNKKQIVTGPMIMEQAKKLSGKIPKKS